MPQQEIVIRKLALRDAIRLEESLKRDVERAQKYLDTLNAFEDDSKYEIHKESISKIKRILEEAQNHLNAIGRALDGTVVEVPYVVIEYKGWDKIGKDKEA